MNREHHPDIIGKRYGKLIVSEYAGMGTFPGCNKRYSIWKCMCDCGNEKNVRMYMLTNGQTTSCGCVQKEWRKQFGQLNTTHHSRKTRLYDIWVQMRKRCQNPNDGVYKYYGGKGVSVCDDWDKSFESFQKWAMSNGYNPNAKRGECTIDRINPYGDYEPSNCRWVSMNEQRKNLRRHYKKEKET